MQQQETDSIDELTKLLKEATDESNEKNYNPNLW